MTLIKCGRGEESGDRMVRLDAICEYSVHIFDIHDVHVCNSFIAHESFPPITTSSFTTAYSHNGSNFLIWRHSDIKTAVRKSL